MVNEGGQILVQVVKKEKKKKVMILTSEYVLVKWAAAHASLLTQPCRAHATCK